MNKLNVLFLNPAPSLIKYGMKWGFDKLGHNTYLFDGENQLYSDSQEIQIKKISKAINEHKTDILFCEGYSNMPLPEISDLCRRYGIQFHFWCIEDPVTVSIGEYASKYADFLWTTCIEFVPKYNELGKPSDVLLFACNPDFHFPRQPEKRFQHDLSLVATNYSNRYDKTQEFIMPFVRNNYDIMIYGLWWMDESRPVNLTNHPHVYWNEDGYKSLPYEWLPIVVNSSKIMVGANCSDLSETQTSCRPYETLASSGNSVYLAYYTKAQEKLFGDLIYQAKTGDEMLRMANEILSMTEDQRRQKANDAREFVYKNHNYTLRAQQVIDAYYRLGGSR